ncbi:flagellar hook-length control protein FliK [Burkholderia stabilis]|uniref:flagellar hook-length control protein FliK n=1 Tax=Burkholderia stabilis TaxID=95485 RepID=UPI0008519F01|nr:flagellar hook-length control protein FliK [Burkholderia stabilis]AOR71188.1 flagellar hook-length control protein FliK [Burkholderia stabilis]HDR9490873.1 flagellar hook-length control protein FliK [Burkholderia stabilis]HDR9525930.1 flagellar hook-length control protein FliK [Burkholderia stabilis]HDR9531901.1 flagellar hook-length control protein FliK [Burkholderia stabilis]HDR9535762.1 flagellar hook-length control protein FliK [Burkholderia stabilis]
MTESVSTPRSRSRSTRSSARSRQRSAAAAGSTSARAAARPGSAPAGDASRDERTLDLFGDPVLEPGERSPAAVRSDVVLEADVADDVSAGRQPALDGFGAPAVDGAVAHDETGSAVKPRVAVVAEGVSATEGDDAANVGVGPVVDGVAMNEADAPAGDDAAVKATEMPTADGAAIEAIGLQSSDDAALRVPGLQVADGAAAKAIELPAADGAVIKAIGLQSSDDAAPKASGLHAADSAAAKATELQVADGEVAKPVVEAAAVKSREGRPAGDAVKERRSSSGGKRRATAGTSEAPAVQSATVAASVDAALEATGSNPAPDAVSKVEPQTLAQPAAPAIAATTATTRDATLQADASPSPVPQPVASAASFVTKPSSERTQAAAPAFDPDTHLRPLTDRLAALQADVDGLTRAADREMRRVNRLLLALAVVVLAGLVALILQTRQIANLKQDAATKQQRIDRLAADLSTQQATLMTLEEHHEALLSQVDRLQRSANREAAVAKRARRTR